MRSWLSLVLIAMILGVLALTVVMQRPDADTARRNARVPELQRMMEKLKPLHTPLGEPQKGDWLNSHPEAGQTFAEYVAGRPVTPNATQRVIYIQPLGDFTPSQRQIVTLTAELMGHHFDRPTKFLPDLALDLIPAKARRDDQILTTYVLDSILKPRMPEDAAASIAFTASDLWPGEGWNYVFGEASLFNRVGVWSIHRNGDPDESPEAYRLCLLRTIKTATHETGHMFSMQHCTLFECNMCGCNNQSESDRRPLAPCPECLAKLLWATDAEPLARFRHLSRFCREQGLIPEHAFYQRSLQALE